MNKVKIIKIIHQAVLDKTPEHEILAKLRGMIKNTPDFNIREKRCLYKIVKKTVLLMYYQNGNLYNRQIKQYVTGLNKVEEHKNVREKKFNMTMNMRYNRATQRVFYMCSTHSNPAKDHAEWQGKIYVDRFWREALAYDDVRLKMVAAYIKNHDVKTVQEICGAPVYLLTRPYCKHFFISLDTNEVLGSSINKIKKNHPEAVVHTHNINYRKKYYQIRRRIHSVLNMTAEAEADTVLINRQK